MIPAGVEGEIVPTKVGFMADLSHFAKCLRVSSMGSLHFSCQRVMAARGGDAGRSADAPPPMMGQEHHGFNDEEEDDHHQENRERTLMSSSLTSSSSKGTLIMTSEHENIHGRKVKVTQSMPIQWLSL